MTYGDAEHLRKIKERRDLEKLKRRSPVFVEVAGWVDQGGNREVFDKIRNKQFKNVDNVENFILKEYGSGSRPLFKIKSIIDKKDIEGVY